MPRIPFDEIDLSDCFVANCLRRISDLQFLPRSTSSCRHCAASGLGVTCSVYILLSTLFTDALGWGGGKSVNSPGHDQVTTILEPQSSKASELFYSVLTCMFLTQTILKPVLLTAEHQLALSLPSNLRDERLIQSRQNEPRLVTGP